jgi:hypothetical protein
VGKLKNSRPKIICSLDFCSLSIIFKGVRELSRYAGSVLWLLSFYQEKESNTDLDRQKNRIPIYWDEIGEAK